MSKSDYYVAYPASEQLRKDARHLIQLMKEDKPKKQEALVANVLILLAIETIDVYLVDLLKKSGLKGAQKKLVEGAESIVKKTTQTVIKQTSKKLSLEQQRHVTEHIDSCLLPLQRENLHEAEFIACPITEQFYNQVIAGHSMVHEKGLGASRPVIIKNQKEIINQMVEFLAERLIAILNLGPILQKVVRLATDKSTQLMHSTHEKVFANMNEQEMLNANQHFAEMLIVTHTANRTAEHAEVQF